MGGKVNKLIQLLEKRMLEVFSREVVRELLNVLGGSGSPVSLNVRRINFVPRSSDSGCASTMQETNSWLPKKKIQTLQPFKKVSVSFKAKDCDCSNKKTPVSFVADPCVCSTKSPVDCFEGTVCEFQGCSARSFCGTAYLYLCNGECFIYGCICD